MRSKPTNREKAQAFDSYIKKVLKYNARNGYKSRKKRIDSEVFFSELTDSQLIDIAKLDVYSLDDYRMFNVLDSEIEVKDIELADALAELPETLKDIVILSFFLDLTDREIGEKLSIARSTVAYKRIKSLTKLREIMEENNDGSTQETT